jgi:hypothetical protein
MLNEILLAISLLIFMSLFSYLAWDIGRDF